MRNVGHGDLGIWAVEEREIPGDILAKLQGQQARKQVLARGEVTGHAHVVTSNGPVALVRVDDSRAFLLLEKAGLLDHTGTADGEGHGTRVLDPGYYEVVTERDYDPTLYQRRVVD